MKYAVIDVSGRQHQVQENSIITVDHIDGKVGDKYTIDNVLLVVDDDNIKIGTPTLGTSSVESQIIKTYQGAKLRVFKYKAKSRYHKTQGFRPQLTDIKIIKINP